MHFLSLSWQIGSGLTTLHHGILASVPWLSSLAPLCLCVKIFVWIHETSTATHYWRYSLDGDKLKLCQETWFYQIDIIGCTCKTFSELLWWNYVYSTMHCSFSSHAQVLGTLHAYSHWLCQLNLDALRSKQNNPTLQQLLQSFVSTLVDATTPLIREGIPEKVILSACQVLLSLASNVKPQVLGSLPSVRALMEKASLGKLSDLPNKVRDITVFVCDNLWLMLLFYSTPPSKKQQKQQKRESWCASLTAPLSQYIEIYASMLPSEW